ncbi:MAG: hypothetical protein ABI471_00620 [Sphingomonas bacterium]
MAQPRPQAGVDLAVHRARATGWRGTRGEVARWLEAVPIESLGLGPDELLYLPRLRVQVPLHQGSAPGRMPNRIAAELRALLAGADSGWGNGFSPGRAYRFTSRGRYFAWLVALWVKDGSAAARAAFHTATGETSLSQWQRTGLLQDGGAFVATLARLAEIGCAAHWVARFEPTEIALARRALEQRFALRLEPLAGRSAQQRKPEVRPDPIAAVRMPVALRAAIASLESSRNEWHALPAPGKALLLAAVMLARNPSRSTAQTAELAAAVTRLSDPAEAQCADAELPLLEPQPAARKASGAMPRETGAHLTERRTRPRTPSASPAQASKGAASPPADAEPTTDPNRISPAYAPAAQGHTDAAPPMAAPSPPTPARREPTLTPFLPPDARFETGFGGLFFLVNAFIALGLYPDFARPLGTRLDPSPLWLADRIGRFWFGARYRRDPLAGWIAAHAAPGELPRIWRAEPEWLAGFETAATPRSTVRQGRATLWHPAGFPLRDEEQARAPHLPRRLAGFRRPRPARIAPARLPAKPADRWAACLALYLDARLRLLCGSGLSLLALPARIQTRDLDLSARFALDRHPIQLRIAGLDRNPGWQPAEGRTFAFVFE